MPRSAIRRAVSALLGLWVAVAAPMRAAVGACPMHAGVAGAGHASHGALRLPPAATGAAGHAAHMHRAPHAPPAPAACQCISDCAGPGVVPVPPVADVSAVESWLRISHRARGAAARPLVRTAHLLPFPTAPPGTALI